MLFDQRGRRKYLTPEERRRFIKLALMCEPDVKAFCVVVAFTGCRLSEALQLTWGQVDEVSREIIIRSLKKRRNDVYRPVPVPRAVLTLVRECSTKTDSLDGRVWPWCRATGWKRIKDVLAAAGVAGAHASPKGLRHGFAVAALLSGVPLSLVQRWMGHANIAMTAIYTGVMGEEERDLAKRLWQSTPLLNRPDALPDQNLT
jgi:integrase/recombinase XerD